MKYYSMYMQAKDKLAIVSTNTPFTRLLKLALLYKQSKLALLYN